MQAMTLSSRLIDRFFVDDPLNFRGHIALDGELGWRQVEVPGVWVRFQEHQRQVPHRVQAYRESWPHLPTLQQFLPI